MTDVLDSLGRGELAAAEAESGLLDYFRSGGDMGLVYNAFARWIWHALTERRLDADLRNWHGLILDTASRAKRGGNAALSERLWALTDMLQVSIAMSGRPTDKSVLGRAHVPRILELLQSSPNHELCRSELLKMSGLQGANLSRLLSLLILSGLLERNQIGKEAHFALTDAGRRHIKKRSQISRRPEDYTEVNGGTFAAMISEAGGKLTEAVGYTIGLAPAALFPVTSGSNYSPKLELAMKRVAPEFSTSKFHASTDSNLTFREAPSRPNKSETRQAATG